MDGPNYFTPLRLLVRRGGSARALVPAAMALATLSVALELVPVWAIWRLIDALIAGTPPDMPRLVLMALVAVLLGYGLMGLAMALSHIAAFRMIHGLRVALAAHLVRLPMGWFASRRSGGAKKLIVDEPERLELMIAHGLPEGTSAVATWIAVTIWLFAVDWRMALASVVLTPLSFALLIGAMRQAAPLAAGYQAQSERLNGAAAEYLGGMPVWRIFGAPPAAANAIDGFAAIEMRMGRRYIPLGGAFHTLVAANICVILPVGLWLIHAGTLELSVLCFFVVLGSGYSLPLLKLFNLFHNMAHISMASSAIAKVLDHRVQHDSGQRIPLPHHEIRFEDVRFGYDTSDVLHGVSFTARAGQVTALVGPSGSGKSTAASLIPRLHDLRGGRITLGGVDIRDMALDQLMEETAFVFQDTFLFSGTIAENIGFGRADATEAELHAAARAAHAHDFVTALPDRYATRLGEAGATLSGGERQRIAIARAILKGAPVIVLDEATAFADPGSEALIQDALGTLAKGRTLIIVAHRLHTVIDADRIVVLDRGRVDASGKHADLVTQGGLYARMWHDYTAARDATLRQEPLS